jgi:hypothetical protein
VFLENDVGKRLVFARIVLPFSYSLKESTMKTRLAALALAAMMIPGLASAMCSDYKVKQSAAACPEGQVMDGQTGTCIVPVSS